ncbi:MAG: adenosylcobinamide-GDP ribazoletransferase [Aquificota bacterium]|nr:MAG: adenosylcobinamide-GDP ribazoletransferase [Aquificota bacterium]
MVDESTMVKRLRSAIAFLTLLPVGGDVLDPQEIGGMAAFFPLVGVILGLLVAVVAWLLVSIIPPVAGAGLLLACSVAFTGAFHLDGLADVFDGLALGRGKEDLLAIMKESTVGVFGLSALVMDLLVKYGAMVVFLDKGLYAPLVAAPLVGRWSLVYMAYRFPSAREKGLGALVVGAVDGSVMGKASLWLLVLPFLGGRYVLAFPLVVALLEVYGRFWGSRIGGVTGDVLGGGCEMVEVLVYLVALVRLV